MRVKGEGEEKRCGAEGEDEGVEGGDERTENGERVAGGGGVVGIVD